MGRSPCCEKAKVKRGPWSPEEDSILKSYLHSHGTGGNWISFPAKAGLKRCGKSCRLRWLNYLRPDIKHGGFTPQEDLIISTYYTQIGSRWSVIASQLPGRTDNDIKNYWNTKLKKKLLVGNIVPSKDNLNNNESISNRNRAGDSITSLSPNYSSSSSSSPLISSSSVPKNEPFLVSTPPASSATTWYGLNSLHDYSTDNYHPALYRPILPPADLDRTISVVSQEGSCVSSDSSSLAAALPTDQELGFGLLNYDIWYPNMPDLSLNTRYAEG